MVIKLNSDTILQMKLFGDVTNVSCTDCFCINNSIIFITKMENVRKAIGQQGSNIRILRDKFKKNIRIIAEAGDSCSLAENFLFPLKPKKCEQVENVLEIEFNSSRDRRRLLDNQQKGLKDLKLIINRYYPDISDIRIL